ncbi:MAG: hypothetical protein R3268_03010, partial [Acidiferrobacterales bacterium]|nr:hypothetical protein [Acidiferrobacterales bacterium]
MTIITLVALALVLGGCGKRGKTGAPGPQGPAGEDGLPGPAFGPVTGLSITVEQATVNSAPVIDFMVRNQTGQPFAALVPGDLRFTIAKLIPGMPTNWQNYILTTQTSTAAGAPGLGRTTVQGTRETPTGSADPSEGPNFPPGSLVNYGNGRYTYTFATDITQGQANCPAPCKDAFGRTLDLSFQDFLTHRVGIQTRGDVPPVNATFDFRPDKGAVTTRRDIVKTDSCNECHDALEAHDARIEVKYCVTCHNLGSTDPDSERPAKDAPAGQPMQVLSSGAVDFKQMIHKIHRGASLPTVAGCNRDPGCVVTQALGGEYAIWGYRNTKHTFAEVVDVDPDPGV